MQNLRRLTCFLNRLNFKTRLYARKTVATTDANMKQVHQESLRYINPQACIKVDSDIYVKVSSADPHRYPNGDALIAELHGGPAKNCTASMKVNVSDDERNVEIVLRKLTENTDFHCELAIPIKAALHIVTRHAAAVKNTYGDALKVKALKFINTENVRAEYIDLLCSDGNINCKGILLGKEIQVVAQNEGNLTLDKLQGDRIACKTTQGKITTNCSYVESSKFETDTGCLDLKNVHKQATVFVHKNGHLKMSGVHGNLKVFANEGTMNLQLSELQGENTIETNNLTLAIINISEEIEQNTLVDVNVVGNDSNSSIILDNTLKHLSLALAENKRSFKWPLDREHSNQLKILSKSCLTLGKSSWMDMTRLEMTEKQNKS